MGKSRLALAVALGLIALGCTEGARAHLVLGAEGGWTHLNDDRARRSNGTVAVDKFDEGYNVGARAGYEMGPWRFEGEFSYRDNGLRQLFLVAPPTGATTGTTGSRRAYAEMANVLYDFPVYDWLVSSHLGGGTGVAEQTQQVSIRGVTQVNSTDTEFAHQAIAGIRWLISPRIALDVDYRYFATAAPQFRAVTGTTISAGYDSHILVASIRVLFGPSPSIEVLPVPPAPPPVARRVFLVFFDWDRDTITRDGMAIIQQAAAAWRSGAPVQIMVTGYTDASGSAGYNQRLSERRAYNAANALARDGVPRENMAVSGRGKNDQRVPTADGVREPQNRRVEIVLP